MLSNQDTLAPASILILAADLALDGTLTDEQQLALIKLAKNNPENAELLSHLLITYLEKTGVLNNA